MLNHITVMGRLTHDPEIRSTQSGVKVCSFTLAVDRDYKQGDEKVCDFIPVTCWRNTAEFVGKFFTKGRMAIVDGSLQTRRYEDKNGNKRTGFDIQAQNVYFGDSKRSDDGGSSYSGGNSSGTDYSAQTFAAASDEGLPF